MLIIKRRVREMSEEYYEMLESCPMCGKKLTKRNEGMVCKSSQCKLYFKCGQGWVLIHRHFKSSAQLNVSSMYSKNTRLYHEMKWVKFKEKILERDKYICASCGYDKTKDLFSNKLLCVHHLIYASKNMALYADEDNCITLCDDCHKKIHSTDKYKYSGGGSK